MTFRLRSGDVCHQLLKINVSICFWRNILLCSAGPNFQSSKQTRLFPEISFRSILSNNILIRLEPGIKRNIFFMEVVQEAFLTALESIYFYRSAKDSCWCSKIFCHCSIDRSGILVCRDIRSNSWLFQWLFLKFLISFSSFSLWKLIEIALLCIVFNLNFVNNASTNCYMEDHSLYWQNTSPYLLSSGILKEA